MLLVPLVEMLLQQQTCVHVGGGSGDQPHGRVGRDPPVPFALCIRQRSVALAPGLVALEPERVQLVPQADVLVVANGHNEIPKWPDPPYPGHFDGDQLHALDYDDPQVFEGKRIATLEADAQEERNRRVLTELEATREEVEVLGPEAYALVKAIESGRVTFMQLPEGGTVSVPSAGGGQGQ